MSRSILVPEAQNHFTIFQQSVKWGEFSVGNLEERTVWLNHCDWDATLVYSTRE
jgi:hypothetical protein